MTAPGSDGSFDAPGSRSMSRSVWGRTLACLGVLLFPAIAGAGDAPDLTREPTLYLVGYAHLDTQWRWEYPATILEYLPATLHDNFALFEKYPHYVFNFSGANRYRLMKEYYPADFERMKGYVRAGRWFPAGSSMEEGDVNSPSAESIMRQVLYGSRWFRRELGTTSAEFMLPDSFGFPASLPSILAHMGIRGFSTQKLSWGSAVGTPFNVGLWKGPDGATVIAAFNPGSYSADILWDLRDSKAPEGVRGFVDWPARVRGNGERGGLFADYHYYGTGDTGGAPRESSVARVESMVTGQVTGEAGPLRIVSSTAEQMFLDIRPDQIAALPRYKGELELTEHSAGSLTSQAYQKRWNHGNELLADAAERASVAAMGLGGRAYPQRRLENAWTLVMGGQFHDTAAGTATPKAYEYAWNDEVVAMNQFASVLTSATEGVVASMDTRASGTAIVVYNPLNVDREDIVEASIPDAGPVRVFAPDGKEVPSQRSGANLVFLARVPSVGYAVYDVRPGRAASGSSLSASVSSLANDRYAIRIDANGDIAGIFDKSLKQELLAAPLRLAIQSETPREWPAWNMDWDDRQKPPRAYVQGPATVRVVESGPARAAVEIIRQTEGSTFVQTVRLAAGGAGNRVEITNAIAWKTPAASLKATFPFTASNPEATYNWEVGTIRRGNNEPRRYEVASHQWIDLTDRGGSHGVTVLTGAKYGSDKPDDQTVRLTLLYTPGLGDGSSSYSDQTSQDWGKHSFVYGLAAHAGTKPADWQALRLEQPPIAFETPQHDGVLGKTFSLLRVSHPRVRVLALKKAEESDEVIVRLVELDGNRAENVRLDFAGPVTGAREVNGQEMPVGKATVERGVLVTSLGPFQLKTFAVTFAVSTKPRPRPRSQSVALPFDLSMASRDGVASKGPALPAEMLPRTIEDGAATFELADPAGANAVVARGQTVALPEWTRRVHILAAAEGDRRVSFQIGGERVEAGLQDWRGYAGQWDNRLWEKRVEMLPPRADAPPNAPQRTARVIAFAGLEPAFIKRAPIAWFASHHHDASGANVPYAYSYLFAYSFAVPAGASTLTLPDDDKVRVLAVTATDEGAPVQPAQPLYDTFP
jgi:alpha-mannosidase